MSVKHSEFLMKQRETHPQAQFLGDKAEKILCTECCRRGSCQAENKLVLSF